ncbi:MAG: hypothetical protein IJY47_06650 [Clostridia bacterium]|nr:hypothetical protein [Clostridia bacterium]
MNEQLLLRAETESLAGTVLLVSAVSFYRLTVNGQFVAFGPARTAKGYARVDEISLEKYETSSDINVIEILVAGYYCCSLATVRQPSFVVAELRRGEEVLLCTGKDLEGFRFCHRVRAVERYSAQRHFGEVWDYTEQNPYSPAYRVNLTPVEAPQYLPRRVPYPTYEIQAAEGFASRGRFRYEEARPCRQTRASFPINERWGGYGEEEIPVKPYRWIQKQQMEKKEGRGSFPVTLGEGEYITVDLGRIECGFLSMIAEAEEDADVVLGFAELCDPDVPLGFNEICEPGTCAFTNINAQNVIEYFLPRGKEICAESFEPYTCRIAVIMVKKGKLRLSSFYVRTFEYPRDRLLDHPVQDPKLREISEAAKTTFVHNAVDLYTDCPSRERAGWLCDSFFTGRAEYFLTGSTVVEDAFLENYRLYQNEGEFPEGALPMCYPADFQDDNKFIPQWMMWYVIEVGEYLTLRNPKAGRELFRDSVYGIMKMLERYENEDGLLEDLPSWNFVEWSTANKWVQNVNYPSNFLYAEMLRAIGNTYDEPSLLRKAERVAKTTRERSFDGEVFIDNALRGEDGVLRNTRNSSEAGQYYAILFGGVELNASPYERLREHIQNSFATFDKTDRAFVPVNAFIGFYLRIAALMMLGEREVLSQDLKRFFGGMVASTGTLWEYKTQIGSHDHGFAAFAALAIGFVEKSEK